MNKNITKSSESCELNELFEEYETNSIRVSDFGLTHKGVRIDYIHRDDNGKSPSGLEILILTSTQKNCCRT